MEKILDKLMSGVTRAEYLEVEPNVCLHFTDAGSDRPNVLEHGKKDKICSFDLAEQTHAGINQ